MRRAPRWLPALVAGSAVFGHVAAEALASGRSLFSVASEPMHLYLLVLPVVLSPLWVRASAARLIGPAIFGFIAVTLCCEGNGLGAAALTVALCVSAFLAWLGGAALDSLADAVGADVVIAVAAAAVRPRAIRAQCAGPRIPYVPTRGNRPPPLLLPIRP